MRRRSTDKKDFRHQAEEADWYATPEGRRATQREFTRALRDMTVSQSRGLTVAKTDPKILASLIAQAKENATRAISIRVPIADLERAKRIAEKTGVGYQTVLKRAIREGLEKGRLTSSACRRPSSDRFVPSACPPRPGRFAPPCRRCRRLRPTSDRAPRRSRISAPPDRCRSASRRGLAA